nr:LacI family DNA-binding transcriptional regulator [Propionicimonas sp.]
MADVAARAGVSRSLVSLVFRDAPGASADTRRRVLESADEIGYKRDVVARSLRVGRSNVIGVVFDAHDDFHANLLDACYRSAELLGYELTLSAVTESRDYERAGADLLGTRAEALIIAAAEVDDSVLGRWNQRLPVVVIGRNTNGLTDVVRLDDNEAIRMLVDHLINLGHRDIWAMEATGRRSGAERAQGYLNTMAERGLRDRAKLIPGDFTSRGGVVAAQQLLSDLNHLPTAVIGSNDLATVGLLETLRAAGLHVPLDISVAGFDNSRIASNPSINLTTVSQDINGMAKLALVSAIEALRTADRKTEEHIFSPRLIARGTTGPLPRRPVSVRPSDRLASTVVTAPTKA